MRVGSIGCDVECDRHRPCDRVVDRRVAVCPIDDRTELALRGPRSGDRHADARAKSARGHGVVHAKQTAIVRSLSTTTSSRASSMPRSAARIAITVASHAACDGAEEPAGRRLLT
jgi:hypothetical protein